MISIRLIQNGGASEEATDTFKLFKLLELHIQTSGASRPFVEQSHLLVVKFSARVFSAARVIFFTFPLSRNVSPAAS